MWPYVAETSQSAGAAAESAARKKATKYGDLTRSHIFVPVAVESLGPINSSGVDFLSTLGKRLSDRSGDPRETSFLFQRISIINPRMNAVAVAGCFPTAAADQDGTYITI